MLARAEASEGGMRDHVPRDDQDGSLGLPSCLEVAEDGSRYLHVMASSMHNVDHGALSPFLFFLVLRARMEVFDRALMNLRIYHGSLCLKLWRV